MSVDTWRNTDQAELATLAYDEWFEHRRHSSEIAEIEADELLAAAQRVIDRVRPLLR